MTVLIIIAALIVLAVLAFVAMRHRRAQREQLREQLSTEAAGHRQELQANAARAQEVGREAEQHRAQFERHRDEAERFRREAEEHARQAEEHAATASELDDRGDRARAAASRHDERATDAEERLEEL